MAEGADPLAVLQRLVRALNAHNLEDLLGCFHPEYESEQPVHPQRGFQGKDRLAENWSWVFDSFADFEVQLIDHAVQENVLWTEWRWTGTHPGGQAFEVRGVMILVVEGDLIRCGRLYLEPLEE